MKRSAPIVCIGDALVDEVSFEQSTTRFPGGAALNVAVALRRLDCPSVGLLADLGIDARGQWLRSFLRYEGVSILRHPTVSFTDLASSERAGSEPVLGVRRFANRQAIRFDVDASDKIVIAPVVVVSSGPLWDSGHSTALQELLSRASGLVVIDPNPRLRPGFKRAAFARNVNRIAPAADLLKLSIADVELVYQDRLDSVVGRLLDSGVKAIFVTRGAKGASLHTASGLTAYVHAAPLAGRVIDTMGAGDASLAALISRIAVRGLPQDQESWMNYLGFSMLVAGVACRRIGGATSMPTAKELQTAVEEEADFRPALHVSDAVR